MIDYSLPTHRVAVWETFFIDFSLSDRTLIFENAKERNSSDKEVDENESRILGAGSGVCICHCH